MIWISGVDLFARRIHRRLREHGIYRGAEEVLRNVFGVVAVPYAHVGKGLHAEEIARVGEQRGGFVTEPGLFFYVNSVNHIISL